MINRMNLIDAGWILATVSCIAFISCMVFYSQSGGPNALDVNIPSTIWLTISGIIIGVIWTITGMIGASLNIY
mgnify:CR=1 FL=1|tara:strand:+ start:2410 stop:2628 length:219 start_codon:yes stop_codon:yes gene_type:complete